LSNLHKIWKCDEEIGEKSGKFIKKIGENRNFHIVRIDTASTPAELSSNII